MFLSDFYIMIMLDSNSLDEFGKTFFTIYSWNSPGLMSLGVERGKYTASKHSLSYSLQILISVDFYFMSEYLNFIAILN